MSLDYSTLQKDVATRLATNTALAGLLMLLEDDPDATPDQLAAFESQFEAAMNTAGRGLALIILSPLARKKDESKDAGLSLLITVPIAICENPAVTRAVTGDTRTNALRVMQLVTQSLLSVYKFADVVWPRPEIGKDGLAYYYLFPERRHGEIAA